MRAKNGLNAVSRDVVKSYRLHPNASLTYQDSKDDSPAGGFVRLGANGRLLRYGVEELLLLENLSQGQSTQQVVEQFSDKFGKSVRPDIVEQFAQQMLGAGVLRYADPEDVVAKTADAIPTSSRFKRPSAESEDLEQVFSSDPLGADDDELSFEKEMDELADLVFGGEETVATPEPEAQKTVKAKTVFDPDASTVDVANDAQASPKSDEAVQDEPVSSEAQDAVADVAEEVPTSDAQNDSSAEDEPGTFENTQDTGIEAAEEEPVAGEAAEDEAAETEPVEAEPVADDAPKLAAKNFTFTPPPSGKSRFKGDRSQGTAQSEPEEENTKQEDAAQDTRDDQEAPGKTKKSGILGVFAKADDAEEVEEPKPRVADPKVARRKVAFERNVGADGKPPSGGMLRLFNPTAMFNVLLGAFGWVGRIQWLLLPLAIFALLVLFNRLTETGVSLLSSRQAMTRIGILATSFLTVNLVNTLIVGMVAQRYGARVRSFGLIFVLFIVPRFSVDTSGVQALDKEGKLAVYAAGLKSRLFVFCIATIIWVVTRRSSTMIPDIAILVELIAAFTFLLSALPLMQGDGYRWMATYFDQPFLRQRSFNYLFGTSSKLVERMPEPTSREKVAFAIYGVGSALLTGLILTFLVIHLSTALTGRFGGTGLVMFFALIALVLTWFGFMKSKQKELRKANIKAQMAERKASGKGGGMGLGGGAGLGGGGAGLGGGGGQMVPAGAMDQQTGGRAGGSNGGALMALSRNGNAIAKAMKTEVGMPRTGNAMGRPLAGQYADNNKKSVRNRWLTRLCVVAGLTYLSYLLFLPYEYEVGGDFAILPVARTEVPARVNGELVELFVKEGDVVEQGQVLGQLSVAQLKFQVATSEAELEKSQSRYQKLLDGPPEEDVQVAREQVEAAKIALPFAKALADRATELLSRGAIPQSEAERFEQEYIEAQQDLVTAEASLRRTEAPALETDIIAARAEVEIWQAQLEFDQTALSNSTIIAPFSGRVVTSNQDLVLGKYFDAGDLFLEIEDHTLARSEIKVSETDIGLVEIGDNVRLKAWASTTSEWDGTVVSIAPLAEEEELGKIVRVTAEFTNAEGFYRPGMSGFAKIDGEEMNTWQAFTRLFDRFFRIEVWGWIP